MPTTIHCRICKMLHYQNLACESTKRFKVRYFLRRAEHVREELLAPNKKLESHNLCSEGHKLMALQLITNFRKEQKRLAKLNKEAVTRETKILSKLAFEHAEALIFFGLNSPESEATGERLKRQKSLIASLNRAGVAGVHVTY